jgi:hypothetical protein
MVREAREFQFPGVLSLNPPTNFVAAGGVYQTALASFHSAFPARLDGSPPRVTSDSLRKEVVAYFGKEY